MYGYKILCPNVIRKIKNRIIMKKLYFTVCLLMAAMFLTAQEVPQAINFQAIARDANSEVMANTPIMIQLTILDGAPEGELIYREIRSLTTNAYGSFSFQIGRDPYMAVGEFADIDWAGGRKFLKIDYDPTATLSFNLSLGTIEFVSVPYAFAAGSVSYIDATGANDGDVLAYNATTGRFEPIAMSGAGGGIAVETDPTVPEWAKAENKPTYDYSEIENIPDLSEYITTESQTIADVAALGNSLNTQLKNVTDPTDAQDAATKAYIDELVAQLQEAINNIGGGGHTITVPSVTTLDASNIISVGAQLSGNVTSDGGEVVLSHGFMYGTSVDDLSQIMQCGSGTSSFTKALTGLSASSTYYYKAYATSSAGTGYGEVMSFTTLATLATTGVLNDHNWVDLGLPSGTKWATCNVGSTTPEGYGDYFAWGETSTKSTYTQDNYTYTGDPNNLPSSADAATANWGSGWRMPTQTEMKELINNCTVTWTIQNGVNGRLFTGSNGNSIFLPAAGCRNGSELYHADSYGYYWSSLLDSSTPTHAWQLNFGSSSCSTGRSYSRTHGFTVRAVCAQ